MIRKREGGGGGEKKTYCGDKYEVLDIKNGKEEMEKRNLTVNRVY